MCAWQEFKYRMLLLRAADCGKNSSTLHQSVAPENEPVHKWTAFCISRSLLHSRIHVTYIAVNRYMVSIVLTDICRSLLRVSKVTEKIKTRSKPTPSENFNSHPLLCTGISKIILVKGGHGFSNNCRSFVSIIF
jgi:hypothetical protein